MSKRRPVFADLLANQPKVLRSVKAMVNEMDRIKRTRGPINLKRPVSGWVAADEAWIYLHPSGKIDVVVKSDGRAHIVELPPRIAREAVKHATPRPAPRKAQRPKGR